MKYAFIIANLFISILGFSQKDEKPDHPIKDLKEMEVVKGDFDNDGKMDKFVHYKGKKNYSYSGHTAEDEVVDVVKVEFANNKVLETKPIKLEYGVIKIDFDKEKNELSITKSPEDEDGTIFGRFATTQEINFKYNNKSNFVACRIHSYSLNLDILTDFIKKRREYSDAGDNYHTMEMDKDSNVVWLAKVNYKEKINIEPFLFTNVDLEAFYYGSKKSKGFDAYIKKEMHNPSNIPQ